MRTLKLHFPDDALPTLDTFIKQTKEARVFRRAQAVRNVVKGQRLQTVSDTLSFTYSALRKWVHRFASQGVQGLTLNLSHFVTRKHWPRSWPSSLHFRVHRLMGQRACRESLGHTRAGVLGHMGSGGVHWGRHHRTEGR